MATATTAVYVPSTISFANMPVVTTNSGGWANKANYKRSAHGSQATVITCGECHESHGSNYKCLQRYPEDTTTVDGECLRCHNGRNATWPNAPNVKADFTATYHHPTLTVSNVHSNTEDYALSQNRHAECADCHDVHQATSTNPLAGVSGVTPTYGTTAWAIPSYTFTSGATYEYEVCFKCHSYFSYGATPPLGPTDGLAETDPSVGFNPNNQGYHAVVGPPKAPQFPDSTGVQHYYGSYLPPWDGGAQMKCSDCHAGSRRGPHGSVNGYILKASGQALCTSCHDPNFYATYAQTPTGNPAVDGSDTLRSGFSNPSLTLQDTTFKGVTASVYNYHPVHAKLGCFACHSAVPHGWNDLRSLLVTRSVTGRYNGGSRLWNTITVPASRGQWYCGNCHR